MKRYTAVVYDKDADTSYVIKCSVATVGDIEGLVQRYLFNESVENGDTDWDAIEYDARNINDDIVGLEILAVFEGNLTDVNVVKQLEELNIPEGWLITIPDNDEDSKDE